MGLFDDLKGGKKPFPGTQVFCVLPENTKVCSETHQKTAKNNKNGKIWVLKCVKFRKCVLCSSNIYSIFFSCFYVNYTLFMFKK